MIIFIVIVCVQPEVLSDDVRSLRAERFGLPALHVVTLGITFPVAVLATIEALAGFLGSDVGAGWS